MEVSDCAALIEVTNGLDMTLTFVCASIAFAAGAGISRAFLTHNSRVFDVKVREYSELYGDEPGVSEK